MPTQKMSLRQLQVLKGSADESEPGRGRALPNRRTGGGLDSMLLSEDASPTEQPHEEEHDRGDQEHMNERANGVEPDEPQ